ncbi:hypothetical protein FBY40_0153 [Microbacterium sp. SLBN-154]|uniref:hypothetical protein n=1 Tax=Microbacterium sp. SLBN-154 TaxID=2768458 RepID=UPI00114DEDA9|nr:hypothetical protein [Microbacterium sp. SLBN-154]TQK17676.1 hypothetical protein FBY40_0153 [Microbacterium sp. SLBN-154]
MAVKIHDSADDLRVSASGYSWSLNKRDATFTLRDSTGRTVATGSAQPSVEVSESETGTLRNELGFLAETRTEDDRAVELIFRGVNGDGTTRVRYDFDDTVIQTAPTRYASPSRTHVESVSLFARNDADHGPVPGFHSQFFLHPGSTESSILAPVIPAKVRLSIVSTIGRGSTDENAFVQQQWGLPPYFWGGWSIDGWGTSKNALTKHSSDVLVMGLLDVPAGDIFVRYFDEYATPFVRVFGSRWGTHLTGDGDVTVGTPWVWALGTDLRRAIDEYFDALQHLGIVTPKTPSPLKTKRVTMSQWNTWGAQVANDWAASDLSQQSLELMYDQLGSSGLEPEMFVIDDRWEASYGQLRHDEERFPRFEEFLDRVRGDGRAIGLWAAFLRCQDPASMGLTVDDMLKGPDGEPVMRSIIAEPYYLFDVSKPHVAELLSETARQFMRRYRPDLVKFDFGYELPSMRNAAPERREWGGERILLEALKIVVGAMREVDPDVVVMYYNLSPLLLDYVDQHSTDDLYLNAGEYGAEVNRRLFFSSLLTRFGVPTYGSGGYDWREVRDIWFDTVASGPLGSLNSFDGDQSDTTPSALDIARYRGLSKLTRRSTEPAKVEALDSKTHAGSTTAHARSWLRTERDGVTVAALRTTPRDGAFLPAEVSGLIHATGDVVVASLDERPIKAAQTLGVVPAGKGTLRVASVAEGSAIAHAILRDGETAVDVALSDGWIELELSPTIADEPVEWIRVQIQSA